MAVLHSGSTFLTPSGSAASNSFTTSVWPHRAAICSAVLPLSSKYGSKHDLPGLPSSHLTMPSSFLYTARCRLKASASAEEFGYLAMKSSSDRRHLSTPSARALICMLFGLAFAGRFETKRIHLLTRRSISPNCGYVRCRSPDRSDNNSADCVSRDVTRQKKKKTNIKRNPSNSIL